MKWLHHCVRGGSRSHILRAFLPYAVAIINERFLRQIGAFSGGPAQQSHPSGMLGLSSFDQTGFGGSFPGAAPTAAPPSDTQNIQTRVFSLLGDKNVKLILQGKPALAAGPALDACLLCLR